MNELKHNFAVIDSQNVYQGIKNLGWQIDWLRFRVYLKEKYRVTTAYLFIGYIPTNRDLYDTLQKAGFILVFKPVLPNGAGGVKGNIDADLVLQVMIDYPNYQQAIIVSSDGDFYSLVRYLYEKKKLLVVLSPHIRTCSTLLKKTGRERVIYMDKLVGKIGKKKNTA